ncbi:hypothetical protein [Micromonospora sp. NPDC001898]|uniref:hypothetical protein n=1 Tax=Micromonospora sp. NPDC001898 TaxID=3364221 RepID=UPI00368BCB0A
MILSDFAGSWVGTNGFRLMPSHPLAVLPAAGTVTMAAGGHLTSVTYSWEHPDDGPQDGLLVIGPAGEDGSLVAVWGDSWHQKPAPMSLSGGPGAGGTFAIKGDYGGGWGWGIVFDATDTEALRMRMDNLIPADQATAEMPAGPYPVMVMDVRRA